MLSRFIFWLHSTRNNRLNKPNKAREQWHQIYCNFSSESKMKKGTECVIESIQCGRQLFDEPICWSNFRIGTIEKLLKLHLTGFNVTMAVCVCACYKFQQALRIVGLSLSFPSTLNVLTAHTHSWACCLFKSFSNALTIVAETIHPSKWFIPIKR